MKKGLGRNATRGIMEIVLSQLGIILWTSLFATIMTAMNSLRYGGIIWTNYIGADIAMNIGPTILWLAVLIGLGSAYQQGYNIMVAKDQAGFLRMIIGILSLVLFVTLFATVVTNIETVRTSTNVTNYLALPTVIGITPALLFLAGIFGAIRTGLSGVRARFA